MNEHSGGTVECADCHRVYKMTPLDDHYEPAWGGPKVCYSCLMAQWVRRRAEQSGR
jgi:hypothetical protein